MSQKKIKWNKFVLFAIVFIICLGPRYWTLGSGLSWGIPFEYFRMEEFAGESGSGTFSGIVPLHLLYNILILLLVVFMAKKIARFRKLE